MDHLNKSEAIDISNSGDSNQAMQDNKDDVSHDIENEGEIKAKAEEKGPAGSQRRRRDDKRQGFQGADAEKSNLHIVTIGTPSRVTQVTRGGRRSRMSAIVVVGDKNGSIGYGTGKALETSAAKKKAVNEARKSMQHFPLLDGRTVLHDTVGKFGATSILVRKAPPGTSIVAPSKLLPVFAALGIKDVVAKRLSRSSDTLSLLRALINALDSTARTHFISQIEAKRVGAK